MMVKPIWWDYDGVHDGGIKGVRDDAPEEAKKKEFNEYMELLQSGVKV